MTYLVAVDTPVRPAGERFRALVETSVWVSGVFQR